MGRFVEGEDRSQSLLLPESLDDYVGEDDPVRVIEAFQHIDDRISMSDIFDRFIHF